MDFREMIRVGQIFDNIHLEDGEVKGGQEIEDNRKSPGFPLRFSGKPSLMSSSVD
jgi:hypothetical protein